jgi:hypothetical protein
VLLRAGMLGGVRFALAYEEGGFSVGLSPERVSVERFTERSTDLSSIPMVSRMNHEDLVSGGDMSNADRNGVESNGVRDVEQGCGEMRGAEQECDGQRDGELEPQHGQELEPQHGQGLEPQHGQELEPQHGQELEPQHGQELEPQHGQELEPQHGQELEPQHGQELEPQHGQGLELQHGQELEPQHGQELEPQHGQELEPQHGQELEPQHGQELEPQHGQGLKPQHGQELEPQHGQGLEPQHGQHTETPYSQHPSIEPHNPKPSQETLYNHINKDEQHGSPQSDDSTPKKNATSYQSVDLFGVDTVHSPLSVTPMSPSDPQQSLITDLVSLSSH